MPPTLIHFAASTPKPQFDHPRPDRLLSGNPLRTTHSHYECKGVHAGVWECEPGAWRIEFASNKDEFFHVIEGRLRILDETGQGPEFGPGDSGVIPCGFAGVFEVMEQVKKHYVVIERQGLE